MGEPYGGNSDQECEHCRIKLLAATIKLETHAAAEATQDIAGFEIVSHVGKCRPRRRAETDQEPKRDRRETNQNADDQCDQRDREGREPTRMHRRDADQQFVDEGRKGRIDHESDEQGP